MVALQMENETSDVQPKCQGPLQLLSAPQNRCGQTEGGGSEVDSWLIEFVLTME